MASGKAKLSPDKPPRIEEKAKGFKDNGDGGYIKTKTETVRRTATSMNNATAAILVELLIPTTVMSQTIKPKIIVEAIQWIWMPYKASESVVHPPSSIKAEPAKKMVPIKNTSEAVVPTISPKVMLIYLTRDPLLGCILEKFVKLIPTITIASVASKIVNGEPIPEAANITGNP